MGRPPIQPQDKYVVRLPEGMRDRLRSAAADNKRSMNAEIVDRLDRSFYEDTEANFLTSLIDRPVPHTLPPGLAARIQMAAERNARSVREEVVQALEAAFPVAKTAEQLVAPLAALLKPLEGWNPKDPESARHLGLMRKHLASLQAALAGDGDPEEAMRAYRADFPEME